MDSGLALSGSDFSRDKACPAVRHVVLETISLPIEDPAHMPVTRDLSATRRAMIQLDQERMPEGGSDA